jgi:hypothetical protein
MLPAIDTSTTHSTTHSLRSRLRIARLLQRGLVGSVFALLAAGTSLTPATAATPGHSLSVPMFGDRSEALWPLQVGLEIVDATGNVVVPRRELVVADGQHTTFSEVISSPRGSHAFELELVARHHARDAIELEYDLLVRQARFESLTWGDYLLHRLSLAPRPQLGPGAIAAARADIVETRERAHEPAHTQVIALDGARYEIRLYATSLRG